MVRNLKVQIYNFHAITLLLLVHHHAIQLISSQTYQEEKCQTLHLMKELLILDMPEM